MSNIALMCKYTRLHGTRLRYITSLASDKDSNLGNTRQMAPTSLI